MEPVLEVKHIKKTFKQKNLAAVEDVSFQLFPGEVLGIVGESGCGKSTLAKMISRLLDVTEGRLFLEGKDITEVKGAKARCVFRKIQMVFQNPEDSFDPRCTLGDGVGESLRNFGVSRKETKKRVEMLFEQCGLSGEFMRRYPHEVSGGQCQRAAIARAIAIEPKILICDEATSALDVTVQKQVMELLRELKKQRKTAVLFICHDLALVQQFCDRVLVMEAGRIVEQGTPDAIINDPKAEYTKQLISSVL